MTSHTGRLYAAAATLLVLFALCVAIATRPWKAAAATDPRLVALAAREQRLAHDAALVRRVVRARWQAHRAQLAVSRRVPAGGAAPPVRIVMLPPLTITRTS